MDDNGLGFELPGFRFKPTEEELLSFYLKNVVYDKRMHLDIIGFLNIYQHDPWDLPGLAKIGEREWYFFVPRDRKHSNGGKPNRTTEHGFWKATGSDRKIFSLSDPKRIIGLRKTLVFYKGRAPRGTKTDWIMNEYRLNENVVPHKDIVLCKIYRKATSMKELEQRAAKEEATLGKSTTFGLSYYPTSPLSSSNAITTTSNNNDLGQLGDLLTCTNLKHEIVEEVFEDIDMSTNFKKGANNNNIQLPFGKDGLEELQVPKFGLDWAQDPFSSQFCSPWFENLLNFNSPTLISQIL